MKKGTFQPNINAAKEAYLDDEGCYVINLGSYVATNGMEIPVTITTSRGGTIERLIKEEWARRVEQGVVCITDLKRAEALGGSTHNERPQREKTIIEREGARSEYTGLGHGVSHNDPLWQGKGHLGAFPAQERPAQKTIEPLPERIIKQLEGEPEPYVPDASYQEKEAYLDGLIKGGMEYKEAWKKTAKKYGL